MWDYIELPINEGEPRMGEQLVERCVTANIREYGGTVFLFAQASTSPQ